MKRSVVEVSAMRALLDYWISWFVLQNGTEDGLNSCVFLGHSAHQGRAAGTSSAIHGVPLCNTRSVSGECYQIDGAGTKWWPTWTPVSFICSSGAVAPKSIEYRVVVMEEVVVNQRFPSYFYLVLMITNTILLLCILTISVKALNVSNYYHWWWGRLLQQTDINCSKVKCADS